MSFAWILCALAQVFGAVLGFRALFDPHWAARLVRLKPDEQEGGFAEFRATYGGVFALAHAGGFLLTAKFMAGGEHVVGLAAAGAAVPLAAAWAGAALGRCFSMWKDKTSTRFNMISASVEACVALAIGAPWLGWFLSPYV